MNDVQHVISIIPIEVALDHRLTLRDVRVLIALYSFRGKSTDTVWPTRATLAKRCGYPETRISTITSRLVSLGWLCKEGVGGHSKATRYHLTVPDVDESTVTKSVTVTRTATVTGSETVTATVTPPVTKLVTPPVTKLVTGKEVTSEVTNEVTILLSEPPSAVTDLRSRQCPHMDIIDAYHEVLPELPGIIASRWPGSKDAEALKTRWREDPRHQNLEFWLRFFSAVRTNPHWMGQNDRGWQANLRWLVNRTNFDKVLERMVSVRKEAAHG